jgi:hypothetical protein
VSVGVWQTCAWQTATAQAADERGKAVVKVMVAKSGLPSSGDADFERRKTKEMTKIALDRVRTRLTTARIKHFSIENDVPGTILVTARGGVSHELLAGIVVPPGRFELRPSEPVGARWTQLSATLPEGVEIRQEKSSLAADHAYLWSRSRQTLQKVLAKTTFEGVDMYLYPQQGGWRTLALSAPVATHDDISNAAIRKGKTGDFFVQVNFDREIAADHIAKNERRTWAVVLDSEIVSTFERLDPDFGASLTMTVPDHLGDQKVRRMWAQQVAGRLAAYLPVPLVEL